MNGWIFAKRSFLHNWRVNLAVILGAAISTAVITGALIVGDSVRGSLLDLTIERLGKIDEIVLADRFFRRELGGRCGFFRRCLLRRRFCFGLAGWLRRCLGCVGRFGCFVGWCCLCGYWGCTEPEADEQADV